jgi:hypothetical protein
VVKRAKWTRASSRELALKRLFSRDSIFPITRKKKRLKSPWKLQTTLAKWTPARKTTWMAVTAMMKKTKMAMAKENNKKRRKSAREMK